MKSMIRYGIMAGLVVILVFLLGRVVGSGDWSYQNQEILGYVGMLLGLSIIYFGIQQDRSQQVNENQSAYSFGRGFRIGSGISAFGAAVFGIFISGLFLVKPQLLDQLMENYRDSILNSDKSAEEIDVLIQQLEQVPDFYRSPLFQGLIMFLTVFFIGLILTSIFSMILRKGK